jgi:GNAT superfamily N-acetyltransferase
VAFETSLLRETDDRSLFRSGDPDLDRFFALYAGQNQFRHHLGTTYVAADAGTILGYATVAAGNIEGQALPGALRRWLPAYPLPVLRLARLAVDTTAQGRGVGSRLLRHIFLLALTMSEQYGCVGIMVDAKANAIEFYTRFGFSPLELEEGALESRPRPAPMFLPLDLAATALKEVR